MDDERFDALSRVLGERASRRGALGALAGLAGLLGAGAAEAKPKRRRGKKRQPASVDAEALASLSCARLCSLIFPFSRRLRGICLQNCECFRRCLAITDPAAREACLTAIVTDPRLCAAPERAL
jgi:hypothetical protein